MPPTPVVAEPSADAEWDAAYRELEEREKKQKEVPRGEPAAPPADEWEAAYLELEKRERAQAEPATTPTAAPSLAAPMSPAEPAEGAAVPMPEVPKASGTREARGLAGVRYAAMDPSAYELALRQRIDLARARFQEQNPLASQADLDERLRAVETSWRIAPASRQSNAAAEMYLDSKTSPKGKQYALELLFPMPTDVILSADAETWQSRARRIEEGGPSAKLTKAEAEQYGIKKADFDKMLRDTSDYTSTTDVLKDVLNPTSAWNTLRALSASTGVTEMGIKAGRKLSLLDDKEADLLLKGVETAARNYELEDIARSLDANDRKAAETKFDSLPFNKLPAAMDPKRPDVAAFRKAYTEKPGLFLEQDLARLENALFNNKSDERVQEILNEIPQEKLRLIQPDVGLPMDKVKEAVDVYKVARKELGLSNQADNIGGYLSALMYEPVTTQQGVLYRPSTIGHVMNLAGITPELAYQAEVPIGALLGVALPGGLVARAGMAAGGVLGQKILAGTLNAVGAKDLSDVIDSALIPTKAGVDTMIASRKYDDVVEALGIDPEKYSRVHSPKSTYLSRVRAAALVPEAQGFGALQIREAAGLPENTFAGRLAFGLDLGADLMFEPERFIAKGLTAPRSVTRAWKVSQTLPENTRLQGAFAAAAPKTYSRVRAMRKAAEEGQTITEAIRAGGAAAAEADTLSALHTALRDGFVEEIKRGENPLKGLSAARRKEVERVVRDAGIKIEQATSDLDKLVEAVSLATVDAVDAGIRKESVANRGKTLVGTLRESEAYKARRGELDDAVRLGIMSQEESDAAMAALETQAHRFAADSAKTGFATPEAFFEQVKIVTREEPPAPSTAAAPTPVEPPTPAAPPVEVVPTPVEPAVVVEPPVAVEPPVEVPAPVEPVVVAPPTPAAPTLPAPPVAAAPPEGIQPTWYRGFGREEPGAIYTGATTPILGGGRYYATTPDAAKFYGPELETREIRPKNPLVIRSDDQWRALTREAGWQFPNPFGTPPEEMAGLTAQLEDLLRQRGHDAVYIILDEVGDSTRTLDKVFGESQAFVPSWADEAAVPAPVVPEAPKAPPVAAAPPAEPPLAGRKPLTTEVIETGLGKQSMPLRKAMDFIIARTDNPFHKRLAERLLQVGGRFDDATFQIVQGGRGGAPVTQGFKPSRVTSTLKGTKTRAGAYGVAFAFPKGGPPPQVFLSGSKFGAVKNMEVTILHEALHVATHERYVLALDAGAPPELKAARDQIRNLTNQVRKYIKELSPDALKKITDDPALFSSMKLAVADPLELITYGFTDAKFREFLKTVPVTKAKGAVASAWSEFVSAVADLVGIKRTDTNALASLIESTEQLMSVPSEKLPPPTASVGKAVASLSLQRAPLEQPGLPVALYARLRAAIERLPEEVKPGIRTVLDGIVAKTPGVVEGRVRLADRADEVVTRAIRERLGGELPDGEIRELLNLNEKAAVDSITRQELLEELDYRGRRVTETPNEDGSSTLLFEGLGEEPDARLVVRMEMLDSGANALVVDAADFGENLTVRPIMAKVASMAGARGADAVVFRVAGTTTDGLLDSGLAMATKAVGVEDALDGVAMRRFDLDPELFEAALPEDGIVLFSSNPVQPTPARAVIDLVNNGSFAGFVQEDAKLLRTLGGDLWTDSFLSNFDHNVVLPDGTVRPGVVGKVPTNGSPVLTNLGTRQFEASLHTYLTKPRSASGPLRAAFDKFYTLMQVMYLKARGITGDPTFIQMQLDALLRPDELVRNQVAVVLDTPLYGVDTIYVKGTLEEQMAASVPRSVGKSQETYRTSRGIEDLRQILNIKKGDKTVNLADVFAEAYAHVLLTEARRNMDVLGRGQRIVRVGTRSAVPEDRLPKIQKRLANRLSALNVDARRFEVDPTNRNYLLIDEASRPGIRALVKEIQNSWYSDFLPAEVTRPGFDASRIHVDVYDRVRELHKDLLAGPGSLRDRIAESVPTSVGYVLQKVMTDAASRIPTTDKWKRALNETFVVNTIGSDVADPGVVEIFDYARRSLGEVDKWIRKTADEISSNKPDVLPRLVEQLADKLIPPLPLGVRLAPGELPSNLVKLRDLNELFVNGSAKPLEKIDKAIGDAVSVQEMLDQLDNAEQLFLDFKPTGVPSMTDLERRALIEARRISDNLEAGIAFEELTDFDKDVLQDALNIIAEGIDSRNKIVDETAAAIAQAMFGGESKAALQAFSAPNVRYELYSRFYEGDWAGMFKFNTYLGLSVTFENFGEFQTRFSQSQAVLAMVGRLKAQQILTELSEKLALYGARSDMEWLTRNYKGIGSIKNRRDFVGNVSKYINAELAGSRWAIRDEAGKILNEDMVAIPHKDEELAAYVQANETLNRYGYKRGAQAMFEELLLSDGTKVQVPSVFAEEYKAALTRHTALTGGFTEASALADRAPSSENIVDIEPTAKQKAALRVAEERRNAMTVAGGVVGLVAGSAVGAPILVGVGGALAARNLAKVLSTAVEGFDMTLRYAKVGLTTGLLVPNPAYYVCNFVGGFFQAAAAVGSAQTIKAIFSEPRLVAAVIAEMADSRAYHMSAKPLITTDGRVFTVPQIRRVAEAEGLSGSFVQAETVRAIADDLRRMEPTMTNKVLRPFRNWQQALTDVATSIDNYYRISLFTYELKAGKNATEAAATARKAAFDYTALTDAEKKYMRSAVLFYSFLRRNVDLFYDTAMTNPGRILAQLRMANYSRRALLKENAEVVEPSYLEGRVYLFVRRALQDQPDAGRVAVLLPELPAVDVMQLAASVLNYATDKSARQDVLSRFAPIFQAPAVFAFEMEAFSGRQFGSYDKIPWWLYSMDLNLTGGVLTKGVFGAEPRQVNDPLTADREDTGTYIQATNAKAWWVWRNFLQFPGAGRSMSTLESIDYADAGIIETMVAATEAYRRQGGIDVLDDAFRAAGEVLPNQASGLPTIIEPDREVEEYAEMVKPREGFTTATERMNIFGIRSTRVSSEAVGVSKLYEESKQAHFEASKNLNKASPYRRE